MASLKPRTKEGALGVGGAAALILIYVGGLFGLVIPPEVAGAAVLVIGTLASRLKGEDSASKGRHVKE